MPVKKKRPLIPSPAQKAISQTDAQWHNGGGIEIHLYVRSLQKAAKALIANLNLEPNAKTVYDASPVVLLYRQALELHLKALVGEGSNFLPSPTDPITLLKTHSLRWLAQIVGQIIRAVKWESDFKCESIANFADFSALVNELEGMDPVACVVHSSSRGGHGSVPHQLEPPKVVQIARRLDALLDLLDATADALAAEWDQRPGGETFGVGDDLPPTIH